MYGISMSEKLPPQNLEAEANVLGAILFDPEAMGKVIELLRPEFFYLDTHQKIFTVMFVLFDKGRPIDLVTISEGLKADKALDDIGGNAYLSELVNSVSTSANVMQHAEIVHEKYLLRAVAQVATHIVEEALDPAAQAQELLDKAENDIFQVRKAREHGTVSSMKELVKNSIEKIDALYQNREAVTGVATGFTELDRLTSGFHKSDLVIVAGRPSMGKSAFALNIVEHVAVNLKKAVAFFSLEMSKEQLTQRLLCSHARVDAQKVRTGFLSQQDWPKLTRAAGKLSEAPIFIDDTPGLSAFEVRAKARRMTGKHKIEMIVIDYLQLMQSGVRVESRQQEISDISRRLKALARELDVPVIAISQLSRAVEQRHDKRPMLSDLRESGSIEQDADIVIMLVREEYYHQTEDNRGKAEIIIGKQRNGPVGSIEVAFINELTRFENLSLRDGENVYN